jgi:hypothetical protein
MKMLLFRAHSGMLQYLTLEVRRAKGDTGF